MRSLYLTFIRPYLEFAVPVWCPFLKGDIDMIEQVQQRASKLNINANVENNFNIDSNQYTLGNGVNITYIFTPKFHQKIRNFER